jgi:signal transduction histidine kinase
MVRQAARKIDEQQRNLLKMQSELIVSQRMAAVGEMAAAVAHGIGNPLSSIRAAAQVALLESTVADDSQTKQKLSDNLHNIMRQVDRVQRRMQGLLNFAKPLEPHPIAVEVNKLVRDVVETMHSRFSDAKVGTTLELAPDLPLINADLNHLEQALMVLMTNALEATPKDGVVTIRTCTNEHGSDGKGVRISIEDNGEGIPNDNRERVFEPFFTTKPHGTGIGLPLAKKFIEINGGKIDLKSGPETGTKVDIILPVAV